ncbi:MULTISPECIES: phasin family protein [Saccharibacillus]|jgi:polyhydroxyalkanoate synthesis regulator phasin|uniref:Phasin family protein n=1 Tax=Saccharibacillus brassicae TaxID=2583377 RepID=A0A4Y6UT96_SACBS|nr:MULTISPECIES: phasin family protein [Saccharibacillus]MWJ30621.1 polyhydroxyalkanoate synthesis regulator [Saccharibacillus sp. WB 17]QDH20933.1 phasin family protein [Saccharibacillus brassicae]
MSDLFKKALSLGIGLTVASKEKVEKTVEELVKKGEIAPSESKAVVNKLIERGEEERSTIKNMVQDQVRRVLQELDVPSGSDVVSLEQRIAVLEQRVAQLEGGKPAVTADPAAETNNYRTGAPGETTAE